MASPARIVRALLVARGGFHAPATARQVPFAPKPGDGSVVCYCDSLPDDVDRGLLLKDVAGLFRGKDHRTAKAMTHPGLALLLRSDTPDDYDVANALAVLLDGVRLVTVVLDGASHYLQSVDRTSDVVSLGEEVGTRRWHWSLNARVAFQDRQPSLG